MNADALAVSVALFVVGAWYRVALASAARWEGIGGIDGAE